jgi:hypothetical protein
MPKRTNPTNGQNVSPLMDEIASTLGTDHRGIHHEALVNFKDRF